MKKESVKKNKKSKEEFNLKQEYKKSWDYIKKSKKYLILQLVAVINK